jgi:hypothetical protein
MPDDTAALRLQVARQVAHWRAASAALQEPENFASVAAWHSLERYLDVALRGYLAEAASHLQRDADELAGELAAAVTSEQLERVRLRVIRFRRRYLQLESLADFFGDAVNSRTSPHLAALLRGCDALADMSMRHLLEPLGREVPGVVVYVDKGLGASLLRAGLRLYAGASLSRVAGLKIARQNLHQRPTALVHETGHQIAAILGWNAELAALLDRELGRTSAGVARTWAGWASEIAADTYAFAFTGYGSVAALHDVVSGGPTVFSLVPGDPHPLAYLRVLLATELTERTFGPSGPWNDLARAWVSSYPLADASPSVRALIEESIPLLGRIAELCLLAPMRAFEGRPLVELVDPLRVRPEALAELERTAGPALTTSPHWVRTEGLRMLALTSYRAATDPERFAEITQQYEDWMLRLGAPLAAAA